MTMTCEDYAQGRVNALSRFDKIWIDALKREVDWEHAQWRLLARAALTGSELFILGAPARVEITWPEGPPFGLTNEQIAGMIP